MPFTVVVLNSCCVLPLKNTFSRWKPKWRNPSHWELLCVLNVSSSSLTMRGAFSLSVCENGRRPKHGCAMLLSGQSVGTRVPSVISLAAARTTSGVRRLSMPHWSSGPKRPQALPRGPSLRSGRASKGGLVVMVEMGVNECNTVRPYVLQ